MVRRKHAYGQQTPFTVCRTTRLLKNASCFDGPGPNASKSRASRQDAYCWLGEDSVFTGLIDVALEIADELASQYPDEFRFDYRNHAKTLTLDEAAQSILGEVIRRLGDKSIILIIENLDRAFRGLGDTGQKKWRAFSSGDETNRYFGHFATAIRGHLQSRCGFLRVL